MGNSARSHSLNLGSLKEVISLKETNETELLLSYWILRYKSSAASQTLCGSIS